MPDRFWGKTKSRPQVEIRPDSEKTMGKRIGNTTWTRQEACRCRYFSGFGGFSWPFSDILTWFVHAKRYNTPMIKKLCWQGNGESLQSGFLPEASSRYSASGTAKIDYDWQCRMPGGSESPASKPSGDAVSGNRAGHTAFESTISIACAFQSKEKMIFVMLKS